MALRELLLPWDAQPPAAARIDWSNPLTRGLQFAAIGGATVNVANGYPGTRVGTVTSTTGPYGPAQATLSSGGNRIDYLNQGIAVPTEGTFGAIFVHDSVSSNQQYLILRGVNTGAGLNALTIDTSDRLNIFWGVSASGNRVATTTIAAGEWAVVSGSTPVLGATNNAKLFKNGATCGLFAETASANTFATDGNIYLSGRPSDNARNLGGAQALSVFWARVLTDEEHVEWAYDPWQLFEPRRIFVPVSAGGGGSHDATGAMSAQSATVSGSAAAVATYTSSGALTAQAATVAGSANHVTTHASSGVLEAQAAAVSGAANHVGAHGSTGALEAQAATVAGSADHAAGGAFSATGALTAQAAAVAGSAVHLTLHTATGALVADSATAAGSAVHYTLHTATGDLAADAASVGGAALHSGDGAEVARPFTGAGRHRRTRQRVVVEIDGEDFIAESPEEAQAILDQAKEAAEEKAKLAVERATKARTKPTRKVLADARKSLELPEISAPGLDGYADEISRQIEGIYQSAIQTIEVAALLRKRELAEEDDEDILMLIA